MDRHRRISRKNEMVMNCHVCYFLVVATEIAKVQAYIVLRKTKMKIFCHVSCKKHSSLNNK